MQKQHTFGGVLVLVITIVITISAFTPQLGFAQANSNTSVEALVRAYFTDIPVMIDVARCESGFRQFTNSGNVLYGGASNGMIGIFQFHARVHQKAALDLGFDIATAEGNLAYARYVYDREGTTPWLSSEHCWGAQVTPEPTVGASVSAQSEVLLTQTLRFGMSHAQVRTLQQKLNALGFTITESGPGSPGNETTLFGALTLAAVRRFQCEQKIVCSGDQDTDGYGLVGPKTRAALLVARAQKE